MTKEFKSKRLLSLDALRGFDMFLLFGLGGIFRALPNLNDTELTNKLADQFRHVDWNGFTIWDLIFPMFIFIVGVAMPFSLSKRRKDKNEKKQLYKHILIRTLILMFLGAVLMLKPGLAHPKWGYYSVLYRIGFAYFFAAIIMMNTSIKAQVYWTLGLILGYWALMRFAPIPSFGIVDFYSREGNLMSYLGKQVSEHISPNLRYVFNISLISSVGIALLGGLAGHWLMSDNTENKKTKWLLLAGIGLILLSLLIHLDFPINKNIGSTSFVFLTSGISTFLLGSFYWLIDVKGYKKWAFFLIVIGMNSIAIYVAGFLIKFTSIAKVFVGGFDFGNANALVLALAIAALKWLFCYYLYKQKIFFKI